MSSIPSEQNTVEGDDEEAEDTIAPLCTCGHPMSPSEDFPAKNSEKQPALPTKTPTWLESSFVHLLAPRKQLSSPNSTNKYTTHQAQHQQHGFLESHQHMLQLLDAAQSSDQVSLCTECIDRVATALENDTQRLYQEAQAYRDAIGNAKQRTKAFQNMSPTMDVTRAEAAYQEEIEMLQQEVKAGEAQLAHLYSLYKEQVAIQKHLTETENDHNEELIALELDAKSFDNSIQIMTNELAKVELEVNRLCLVKLPLALFNLQVDQRGLRYPLINQLRLAYRPKGDVPLKEIQVAWSQATQLLLMVGTLLQYPSNDWKLVPLADCAKLIYRRDNIYNLTPGDCRSLLAWNALLHQVVKHASSSMSSVNKDKQPPFPSTSTSIGSTELTQLDRMDHGSWSQVIHRLASNLLWLSECASQRVAYQVEILTHSIV